MHTNTLTPGLCKAAVWITFTTCLLLATPSLANETAPGVTPDEALKRLQDGNARFAAGKTEHPRADAKRRTETVQQGQHPFATIVSCSDSRVPVEVLFDQGIGDVFVIRVAGNVCDVDEIGTIEYGVDHLNTPLLVVLGHSKCGAVTAVATKADLHDNIVRLVDNIAPAVAAAQKAHPNLHGEALVPEAIKANIWQGIEDALKSGPAIRERAKAGKLKIVGALYDLAEGKVQWLGPHPNQKALLASAAGNDHAELAPAHVEPTPAHTEPAPAHAASAGPRPYANRPPPTTQPTVQHTEPPARHAEPPTKHVEPAVKKATSPVATAAPPAANAAVPAAHAESQPAAASPPVTTRPHSVARGPGVLERCAAEDLYREGCRYLDDGQYPAAAEKLAAALEIDSSLVAAMNDLAGTCYVQREYQKAVQLYDAVLAKDRGHRQALRGKALAHATLRQYAQARDTLHKLLTADNADAQTWLDLGDVLFLMGDATTAQKHWTRAASAAESDEIVVAKARGRLQKYVR